MKTFLLIVFLAINLLGSFAFAETPTPILSCKNAQDDILKVLCNDKKLKQSYQNIRKLFHKNYQKAPTVFKRVMIDGFFEWNRFLFNSCSPKEAPKGKNKYIKECLQHSIASREFFYKNNIINDINAGFFISEIDYTIAYRNDSEGFESDRRNVFISEKIEIFFEKLNSNNSLRYFSFNENDIVDEDNFIDESGDLNWDLSEVTKVYSISRKFLNIEKYQWGFGGGPHGYGKGSISSYILPDFIPVEPNYIFKIKHNWQEKLFQLSVDMLKKPESEGGFNILSDSVSYDEVRNSTIGPYDNNLFDLVTSSGRWIFEKNYLIIRFNAYEIATHSSGTPEIKIEYSKLYEYFSKNFKNILKKSR